MRRRHALQALVASAGLTGFAGCLSGSTPGADPTETDDGPPASDGQDARTDGGPYSVVGVESPQYVFRLNDMGNSPGGPVPTLDDLDARERRVVDAAASDGYETSDPPTWLVRFLAGTRFVERDGEFLRLHHTLPTYRIEAEAVTRDDVPGAVADTETYMEAVTYDGRRMSGLLRIAQDEANGAALTHVWPSLRELFETYDAVEYHGEVVAFELTEEDPGPPYRVTAEPASLSAVAGGSVWNVGEEPPAVRRVVRAAGEARGTYALDDPPEGLMEHLDAHEYAYLDGRFYWVGVESRERLPLAMDARFTDEGRLELALRNRADTVLELMVGAPRPFGVVHCHPEGDPDARHLLWTDAYEESTHVKTERRSVTMVQDIGLVVDLSPGESVTETYELPDLSPGRYVVDDTVAVSFPDDREGGTFPYRVTFEVR
ncbi:hypothetical protein ACFO0N_00205 [Halobium salinum]|uniref:DUF8130 domain-containing protein n=1 Tax=Halobium salinum TaxID=1364940 RepID=A0ABD5P668_9EURY|nr:hypothetical protein [Halobium salinum]